MWRNKKRKKSKKQQINTENVAILPSRKLLSWSTSPRERERERRALRIYRMVEGVWSDINKVVFFVVVVGIVVVCCPRESPAVVVRRHTQQVNSLLSPIKAQYIGPWRTGAAAATALSNHLLFLFFLVYKDKQPGRAANRVGILISADTDERKTTARPPKSNCSGNYWWRPPPQMWRLTWRTVNQTPIQTAVSTGVGEMKFDSSPR